MTIAWSAREAVSLDVLATVQSGLTVAMIMTPRDALMKCSKGEAISSVMARNTEDYSYLPVVDSRGHFLGLFNAHQFFGQKAPDEAISEAYEPFSEAMVIGANARILDFVQDADTRDTRLVVSGDGVAGLVSISDLQKLPVRTALFTLVTALEMAMSEAIEAFDFGGTSGWRTLLSAERQRKLDEQIKTAKETDRYVSDIALTQFCDKATVIRKTQLLPFPAKETKARFRRAEDLRNSLAHASFYAETPEAATKVSATVREMLEMKARLLNRNVDAMKAKS